MPIAKKPWLKPVLTRLQTGPTQMQRLFQEWKQAEMEHDTARMTEIKSRILCGRETKVRSSGNGK